MGIETGPAVDFFSLARGGNWPAEWATDFEEWATGALMPGETIDDLIYPDEYGTYSERQWAVREAWAADTWFLLRNVWHWRSGGRFRGRVGLREAHFTTGGIPTPFHGLSRIYGLFRDEAIRSGGTIDPSTVAGVRTDEALKFGAIEPISRDHARRNVLEILLKTGIDLDPRPPASVGRLVLPNGGFWHGRE